MPWRRSLSCSACALMACSGCAPRNARRVSGPRCPSGCWSRHKQPLRTAEVSLLVRWWVVDGDAAVGVDVQVALGMQ
jgi:hypothetical protein